MFAVSAIVNNVGVRSATPSASCDRAVVDLQCKTTADDGLAVGNLHYLPRDFLSSDVQDPALPRSRMDHFVRQLLPIEVSSRVREGYFQDGNAQLCRFAPLGFVDAVSHDNFDHQPATTGMNHH